MIGRLTGNLLEKNPPQILLDIQGVGYELDVPMSTFYNLPNLNEKVTLFVQQVIREDAHLLYGFLSNQEREAFRMLVKISGVGPKLALAVLSGLSLNDLADIISKKDSARLSTVPGIGKKTAERLLLELEGKFNSYQNGEQKTNSTTSNSDVLHALLALGYNEKEASWAVKQLPTDLNVSDGIKQSLKLLTKG